MNMNTREREKFYKLANCLHSSYLVIADSMNCHWLCSTRIFHDDEFFLSIAYFLWHFCFVSCAMLPFDISKGFGFVFHSPHFRCCLQLKLSIHIILILLRFFSTFFYFSFECKEFSKCLNPLQGFCRTNSKQQQHQQQMYNIICVQKRVSGTFDGCNAGEKETLVFFFVVVVDLT